VVVELDPDDVMAQPGEAGSHRRPEVAAADDGDPELAHVPVRPPSGRPPTARFVPATRKRRTLALPYGPFNPGVALDALAANGHGSHRGAGGPAEQPPWGKKRLWSDVLELVTETYDQSALSFVNLNAGAP
jgi:hypothetical protein